MRLGNKPTDAGNLILSEDERTALLEDEPAAAPYIKRYVGAEEYIHNLPRYCLWLVDAAPQTLRALPKVLSRVKAVQEFRLKSTAAPTRQAATTPAKFFFVSQPNTEYILVPAVSSELRRYIPIGYMSPDTISSNANYIIADPSIFLFGVLNSAMFVAWVRTVSGRLKSDFQFSGSMVYNTFPFPLSPTTAQTKAVETAAAAVLAARAQFAGQSLAALYDPLTMPPALAAAHAALDRAVDRCYRPTAFATELARLEFLFAAYQERAAPLLPPARKARK
jgi:hypothetical protein